MSSKKSVIDLLIDDDVTFYKKNSFLVRAMTAIVGDTLTTGKGTSVTDTLKAILNDHKRSLVLKLNEDPLSQILELLNGANKILEERGKPRLVKFPDYSKDFIPLDHKVITTTSYANAAQAISSVRQDVNFIWEAYKEDDLKINILRNNYARYMPIAAGLLLINWLNDSKDSENPYAILLCMTALIKLDQAKLYALFRSEAYEEYASRKIGKKHSDELLKHLIPLENELKAKAIDLWKNHDDKRWHAQIAKDLTPEINKPVIEKINKELLEKYPLRETDKKQSQKHKHEYDKRIKYETLSIGRATEILYETAKPYKKNRGPGKNIKKIQSTNITCLDYDPNTDFFIPIDEND